MSDDLGWDEFMRVDMRVGRIVEVEDFPEARRPAWKLRVDFGEQIGVRRSSAQITNYERDQLVDRRVIAVVNFPPKQIGPVRSECLVLGTYAADGTVLLLAPEPEAALGDRVGSAPRRPASGARVASGGVLSWLGGPPRAGCRRQAGARRIGRRRRRGARLARGLARRRGGSATRAARRGERPPDRRPASLRAAVDGAAC